MDPWIDGSMDPWIDGSMDPWIHGSMHGSMDPWGFIRRYALLGTQDKELPKVILYLGKVILYLGRNACICPSKGLLSESNP